MAGETVEVVGMKALRRDINRMAADVSGPLYTAIKAAGKETAEPVAARARGLVPSDTGTLAGTIRTSGTRTGAAVRMGRASAPYAGWLDFGGSRPDGSTREYLQSGRYLFPAARTLASDSARNYSAALAKILGSDAVWTNTGDNPGSVHD